MKSRDYKLCPVCRSEKLLSDFNKDSSRKDGLFPYCRECRRELRRTRYKEGREYAHARAVRKNYGLGPQEYRAMYLAQGGRCAICLTLAFETTGRGKRLQVDHCHSTGEIRGLLCSNCNRGLGNFKDNPEILHKAAEYLLRWKEE